MKDSELTMGSFCTGIGGLDLGLHWAFPNATTLWQVEYEPWPRKVLEKHFPSADRSKTDVRELHGADLEPVDILSMGFPCQSISVSSKQGRGRSRLQSRRIHSYRSRWKRRGGCPA